MKPSRVKAWRIIPALAGNTSARVVRSSPSRDHPRSRGEYPAPSHRTGGHRGSSPLSRGIRTDRRREAQQWRIIPALAGNTGVWWRRPTPARDHPRSRGEYGRIGRCHRPRWGSSPLSRGIPEGRTAKERADRIIPALAGNTAPFQASTRYRKDHPRSRGEYILFSPGTLNRNGSSPLSRGIQIHNGTPALEARIIPALAGNTMCCCSIDRRGEDHPRSRGEYFCSGRTTPRAVGSSPLSRGILEIREASLG